MSTHNNIPNLSGKIYHITHLSIHIECMFYLELNYLCWNTMCVDCISGIHAVIALVEVKSKDLHVCFCQTLRSFTYCTTSSANVHWQQPKRDKWPPLGKEWKINSLSLSVFLSLIIARSKRESMHRFKIDSVDSKFAILKSCMKVHTSSQSIRQPIK